MFSLVLILLPLLAALGIFAGAPARFTARLAAFATLILCVAAAINGSCACSAWSFSAPVLSAVKAPIHLALGVDGTSGVMLLLSGLVLAAAVFSSEAPTGREKLFYSSSLLIGAGAIGAFLSRDVFFFYAFHELALIPTFLMIGILGRGQRREAAWKATIYLATGSIILLAGLLWLSLELGTFNLQEMLVNAQKAPIALETQSAIAALLLIGFGTLVSLFPFHSWAAPAYACAPAPTAMLHSGVLKKFGLYGLIRFIPMVLPGMQAWLDVLLVLLLANILWVGLVTLNQKRLDLVLGNSSVMHMGYIFLALAAWIASGQGNDIAVTAALVLMFAHGISIALLFALTKQVEDSTGTLDLGQLGGLAKATPRLAFLFGLAAMASIGLPGLANFAGELMVFLAGFNNWEAGSPLGPVQIATIFSLWGVVISAVYMLRAYRRVFQGPTVRTTQSAKEIKLIEQAPCLLLAATLLVVGCFPQLLVDLINRG